MENPREVQVDELKLVHTAFGVNVDDLGGEEVVRLVYLGLCLKVRATEIER